MDRARARRRAGEMMDVFDLRAKAARARPEALGRHAPAPAAGPRAHARAAPGDPRRADRRRRLRAAPGAVGATSAACTARARRSCSPRTTSRRPRSCARRSRSSAAGGCSRATARDGPARRLRRRLAGRRLRQGDGVVSARALARHRGLHRAQHARDASRAEAVDADDRRADPQLVALHPRLRALARRPHQADRRRRLRGLHRARA